MADNLQLLGPAESSTSVTCGFIGIVLGGLIVT
jgi:hypothetical protein